MALFQHNLYNYVLFIGEIIIIKTFAMFICMNKNILLQEFMLNYYLINNINLITATATINDCDYDNFSINRKERDDLVMILNAHHYSIIYYNSLRAAWIRACNI